MFETIGFDKEWDGRYNGELLPPDTYYYTIDLNLTYINTNYKGIVTILR
jgi:gliding motility-associated-like protein